MDIPHCPNPKCLHFLTPKRENWHNHHGYTKNITFGVVPRFRCKSCGRTFSAQTFSIDYYAKKKIDYIKLLEHLVTSSGMLDMSRIFNMRVETIENRIERLAKFALAIQSDLLKILPFKENIAADGFETFSYSQYYPCHINIFAGSESEFIYLMGFSNLRRKGSMTEAQKERRSELEAHGRADPKAIEKSFRNITKNMIQMIVEKEVTINSGKVSLFTDEHKAYLRAFKEIDNFKEHISHQTVSSKAARMVSNPLFPINYYDRLQRKDLSDHARETMQAAKCPSAMMARAVVYRFYHNVLSPRRVKESRKGNSETHAERAGVSSEAVKCMVARRWGKRPFLGTVDLGIEELNTWFCRWKNPNRDMKRRIPKYIEA